MDCWSGIDPSAAEAQMRGVTRRLAEIEEAIESAKRIVQQTPGSFAANLGLNSLRKMQSALEQERISLVRFRQAEKVVIALQGPSFVEHTADLANLGFFMVHFQKLYRSLAQAIVQGPRLRGPVRKDLSDATTIRLAQVFPSSFGMNLQIDQTFDIFGESVATSSLQILFSLLNSSSREAEMSRLSAELGPRTVNHLRKVLENLASVDAGISIKWRDLTGAEYKWRATGDEVQSLKASTSRFRTVESTSVLLRGILTGASLLRDRFEFLSADMSVIEGKIAKEAKRHIRDLFGRQCECQFDRVIIEEAVTSEKRTYYTMTSIVALDDSTG